MYKFCASRSNRGTWELTLVTNIYGLRHSSTLYKISLTFFEICTISTSLLSQSIHA